MRGQVKSVPSVARQTERHGSRTRSPVRVDRGHADLTASETFLERHTNEAVRPMARPVSSEIADFRNGENAQHFPARFEWDDHK